MAALTGLVSTPQQGTEAYRQADRHTMFLFLSYASA